MSQIENVTILKEANVYFDGGCVSYTLLLPDGTKKSVGVILPATHTFGTAAPEIMELVKGSCRVRLAGEGAWADYTAGQEFRVPGDSSFEIEVTETLHYVCHYG